MQAVNPPTPSFRERLIAQPPLMWFSLAFLAGIILGSLISLSLGVWLSLAVFSIFLLIVAQVSATRIQPSSSSLHPFLFIVIAALVLGAARYQFSIPDFDAFHIAFYNDREYDLLIT